MGFPGSSEVKASACNVGDPGSISGWGSSRGEGSFLIARSFFHLDLTEDAPARNIFNLIVNIYLFNSFIAMF